MASYTTYAFPNRERKVCYGEISVEGLCCDEKRLAWYYFQYHDSQSPRLSRETSLRLVVSLLIKREDTYP
jgi:hypothetical protein